MVASRPSGDAAGAARRLQHWSSMSTVADPDPYLSAYQAAFRPELEAAVRAYSLPAGARVLDCPCGNGFYTDLFAHQLTSGTLVAADLSADRLARARDSVRPASPHLAVEFSEADTYHLPFDDNSFDLVWCAQSLITLDDPVRALGELARVTRPGGRVTVLETDEFHHILLPWPVRLELAIYRAIQAECRTRYRAGGKFAQARRLRAGFLEVGLTPAGKRTVVADRAAPFGPAEREFLVRHLDYLREFVRMELSPREMEALERVIDPECPDGLLNRPDSELTCLASVSHAVKG